MILNLIVILNNCGLTRGSINFSRVETWRTIRSCPERRVESVPCVTRLPLGDFLLNWRMRTGRDHVVNYSTRRIISHTKAHTHNCKYVTAMRELLLWRTVDSRDEKVCCSKKTLHLYIYMLLITNHHLPTTHHRAHYSTYPTSSVPLSLSLSLPLPSPSSDRDRPPTYSTEPRVRGRVKGRRRPAPKEAKPRNDVCRHWSGRIKTHCASSPAHVRMWTKQKKTDECRATSTAACHAAVTFFSSGNAYYYVRICLRFSSATPVAVCSFTSFSPCLTSFLPLLPQLIPVRATFVW